MVRRVSNNTVAPNATTCAMAVVLTLALPVSGCSFLFSEGAPDNYKTRASFSCSATYTPPILDTIATGLFGLSALGTASDKEATVAKASAADQTMTRHDVNVTIGVQTAITIGAAAAAIYGYHATSTCRDAESERGLEIARARILPPPYGVPPNGEPPPYWPPPLYRQPPPAARVPSAPVEVAPPPTASP
jgi:hypothetical protein